MTTNELHRELNEWRNRALAAEAQLRDFDRLTNDDEPEQMEVCS